VERHSPPLYRVRNNRRDLSARSHKLLDRCLAHPSKAHCLAVHATHQTSCQEVHYCAPSPTPILQSVGIANRRYAHIHDLFQARLPAYFSSG